MTKTESCLSTTDLRQSPADDSETVAMALPRQSCADVSGR